jgi:Mn-dependent DtxR family transcriptional regulator
MEDYLEAIAKLGEGRRVVKVKQVSQMLGVKMPSVTSALKKLSEQELVEHERYGRIKLTSEQVSILFRARKAPSEVFEQRCEQEEIEGANFFWSL